MNETNMTKIEINNVIAKATVAATYLAGFENMLNRMSEEARAEMAEYLKQSKEIERAAKDIQKYLEIAEVGGNNDVQ